MIIKKGVINNYYGALAALSFICFAYGNSIGWSSPVNIKLKLQGEENPFNDPLKNTEVAWINSLYTFGAAVGGWLYAPFSDAFGRRPTLILIVIPIALSYLAMVLFKYVWVFYVARFTIGIAIGGILTVTSTYETEIPPKNKRGFVFAWCFFVISIGILFSYCVGPYTTVDNLNILCMISPAVAVVFIIIFCEETPYYYTMKNKPEKAKLALAAFRETDANIDDEMKEVELKIREQYEGSLLQQLTGIFTFLMYTEWIFHKAGSDIEPALSTIFIGFLFMLSGFVGVVVMERFNRKTLLIASNSGVILSEIPLGIFCILDHAGFDTSKLKILPLICISLFILTYKFGNGPVCWVVASEMYPTRAKSFCLSFSVCIFFLTSSLIINYFPRVVAVIGLGPVVLFYAGCTFISILFFIFLLIETRGKTLGEIQDELKGTKT